MFRRIVLTLMRVLREAALVEACPFRVRDALSVPAYGARSRVAPAVRFLRFAYRSMPVLLFAA